MLELNKGIDIVTKLGGVNNISEAQQVFQNKMDLVNLNKINHLCNEKVLIKIANAISMCDPDTVFVNTGSKTDQAFIRALALKKGEEKALTMENHTIHYDLAKEQGRIVDRTFYIVNEGEQTSSLAKKILRDVAIEDLQSKMQGIMHGKLMIVGCYLRGPAGSPVSNPALELTSSAYVSHSAEILYRNAFDKFDQEVAQRSHFLTNIHSEGLNRTEDLPSARVFMDRSWQTTYSYNCTYAGNTLLMKKGNHRFCVDRAVYLTCGNVLSEHMFITGIKGPGGRITWCAGAAPSGCGKTTTAMAGDYFIGDDLAQMWRDQNGSIRGINPECGIFGIVQDVNSEGDPLLMELLRKPGAEVIWSNVLIDENSIPHWVGNGETPPLKGFNFQGDWKKGKTDAKGNSIPISHPNARCTVASRSLKNFSQESENPQGVEIRVITYSGRDNDTMPPLWVAQTPATGVVIGASIVSAATAAEVGACGIKRAPWANAPFIPGALGDYMDAQFKFFEHADINPDKIPVIAGLNYFLTDAARGGTTDKLLGEKQDVKVWLAWLERKVHQEVGVIATPIGDLPQYDDLKKLFKTIIDKKYPYSLYEKQFSLYLDKILARIELQQNAYQKEENIPAILFDILTQQSQGLHGLKAKFGSIVKPADLV